MTALRIVHVINSSVQTHVLEHVVLVLGVKLSTTILSAAVHQALQEILSQDATKHHLHLQHPSLLTHVYLRPVGPIQIAVL